MGERETFVRGTLLGAGAIAGAAAIGLTLWGREDWAVGFAVGALVSLGNFHLIARAVTAVTGVEGGRAATTLWKGAAARFVVSAAVLVLVLLVVRAPLLALVAGLLTTQLAMIVLWLMRALRSLA